MGKNDALRIDGYGWGDVEEEIVSEPTPVELVTAAVKEAPFFEDRTPKPQDFERPKKEKVINEWPVEQASQPASLNSWNTTEERTTSPVRAPRSEQREQAQKESPRKNSQQRPPAPKDKVFDLGFELPNSTSQISLPPRRAAPQDGRERRDSGNSQGSRDNWGDSRGRGRDEPQTGRGDSRSRQSDPNEEFDEQLGRSVRVREIPASGPGYVKTGEERKPFTRATPREDPASRTYQRTEPGSCNAPAASLGWGTDGETEDDDAHHHGPVVKDFTFHEPPTVPPIPQANPVPVAAAAPSSPPKSKPLVTPSKAADFDARLMDARFGGDPKNASTSGVSTPQWQPQPPASYSQNPKPARMEEKQNDRDEGNGWGATEVSERQEVKMPSQSRMPQRSASPPRRHQGRDNGRNEDLGWGAVAEEVEERPAAAPRKPQEGHRSFPASEEVQRPFPAPERQEPVSYTSVPVAPVVNNPSRSAASPPSNQHNQHFSSFDERRNSSSGSIRIEDPSGTPVDIKELAGNKAGSSNGRDPTSPPKFVSVSSYMVGYGHGPDGGLDPVSAGQQLWVTCPYCHCGFGYPPLPVTGAPPAFVNPNQFNARYRQ